MTNDLKSSSGNPAHPAFDTVLLHVCCGVCAAYPIQKLREDGHVPIGYFYNPNINSEEEYLRRLDAAKKVADKLEFELIEGEYDADNWLDKCGSLKDEPEGGKRCELCFMMRLEETQKKAKQIGVAHFTTTLTVSKHKDSALINDLGAKISEKSFLTHDFKKDDGFKKSLDFARQHKLYLQKYCGCRFSIR